MLCSSNELQDISFVSLLAVNSFDQVQILEDIKDEYQQHRLDKNEDQVIDLVLMDKSYSEHQITATIKPFLFHTDDDMENVILIMFFECQTDQKIFCIEPKNQYYVIQSLILFVDIIFLLFQVPQDTTFGDDKLALFNSLLDSFNLIFFAFDIILNFFVAIEVDDEDNKQIYDLNLIANNQLKYGFNIDLIATIPFDQLFVKQVSINTSILKAFKILKMFKLMKLLKLSKLYNLRNKNIKAFLGDHLIIYIHKLRGFRDLLRQNMQILVASHFYTLFQFQITDNYIYQDTNRDWLKKYHFISNSEEPEQIQLLMLVENVKTATGLGTLTLEHPLCIYMQLMWIFIGLSLFGYGIGNISSYLNQANQQDIEQSDAKSFQMEICDKYNVDSRIKTLVRNDIENWYNDWAIENLSKKSKYISKPVMVKLESVIYKPLILSFKLFEKFDIKILRLLKNNMIQSHKSIKLNRGSVVTDVYFVTKGKIQVYDKNIRLVNFFGQHELYLFDQLLNQCKFKQNINFYELLKGIEDYLLKNEERNVVFNERYLTKLNKCKNQINSSMKNIQKDFKTDDHNPYAIPSKTAFTRDFELDEKFKVQNDYTPVCSDDIEQIKIPFPVIEQIIMNDFESFLMFWSQQRKQKELVSMKEAKKCTALMYEFENNNNHAMIVTLKDNAYTILSFSKFFADNQYNTSEELKGCLLNKVLNQDSNYVFLWDDIVNLKYQVVLNDIKKVLTVKEIHKGYQRDKLDVNDQNRFSCLKKFMTDVVQIQFDISSDQDKSDIDIFNSSLAQNKKLSAMSNENNQQNMNQEDDGIKEYDKEDFIIINEDDD